MTRLALTNTIVGTPPYMAPEQDQGLVCKGTDVYALGICVYEMLTGALPFAGSGVGMMTAKLSKTYVPASRLVAGLPPGADVVLDKALEPDPANRWASAGEFVGRLACL
jgi:serine/threonine-protein kinase